MHPTEVTALCISLLLAFSSPDTYGRTFKIATLAPDGTTWMKEMRNAASEIAAGTNGRVKFKFYPGGVMGNEKSVLRKIRIGQLQGGAFTSGGLAGVYPDAQIYSLPFLFRSYAEVDYVRTRMDSIIREGLQKKGLVAVGISEGGFAYLMSKKALRKVEDLQGQRVWIPEGDVISQAMFEAVGVSPIPLPIADVYTGLQTGLIDTVTNTTIGSIALQWHTKVDHVTDAPLLLLVGFLVIDGRAFNKLSPADQAIVRSVMETGSKRLDRLNREESKNAKMALANQSVKFVEPTTEELAHWQEIARSALISLGANGAYSPDMLTTLQSHLKTYHARVRASDGN